MNGAQTVLPALSSQDFFAGSVGVQYETPNDTPYFQPLLNPSEAAAFLQVHEKTAVRMAREGAIPALRLGKHWRFRRIDLELWVESRIQSARQPGIE